MEAEFAIPEITLTAPQLQCGISSFEKKKLIFIKNVISGKLHDFEQSFLEAKFTTPESTLTEPPYRDNNFKHWEVFYY